MLPYAGTYLELEVDQIDGADGGCEEEDLQFHDAAVEFQAYQER